MYVDGNEQIVSTDANTVGEVLRRAEIPVHDGDVVEPRIDEQITSQVFNINIYRARPFVIIDGDDEHRVKSAHTSPRLIAETTEAVEVFKEDRYETEVVLDIVAEGYVGAKITIDRATPVELTLGNQTLEIRTHAVTVGEMLDTEGVEINENDIVKPSIDTPISEDLPVAVTRVGFETITEVEKIKPPVETINDNNRPLGYEQVKDPGAEGVALVTYQVELRNGEEVKRKRIHRMVDEEPKPRVIVRGNKSNYTPAESRAMGQRMAADFGWTGAQWQCLDQLWTHESGWDYTKWNYGGSGAYGIPQAMVSVHGLEGTSFMTEPRVQIEWGINYIAGPRYGTPCAAYNHLREYNTY